MKEETCGFCSKPCGNEWCPTKKKDVDTEKESDYNRDKQVTEPSPQKKEKR